MYLVICENKDGLSIDHMVHSKRYALHICKEMNNMYMKKTKYHVRKLDLASIDLEKLMKDGEI